MKIKTAILGTLIGTNSLLIGCNKKPIGNNVIKYTPKLEHTINKSLDSLNSKNVHTLGGSLNRIKYFDKKDELLEKKIDIIDLKYKMIIDDLKQQVDSLKTIINKAHN